MILLTGATGFLGSRLLASFLANDYEVVALKRSFSDPSRIKNSLGHSNLRFFDADKEDPSVLFKRYPVRTIVHTATNYGREKDASIERILQANLHVPLRLAELAVESGTQCFINTDSYFNKSESVYSSLPDYSLSKKRFFSQLTRLSPKLKIINVVPEHMYGPYDSLHKFVETMIQKIAIMRVPRVSLTHGLQKRDFIYLDDVVSAYLKLIEFSRQGDFSVTTFELGTGQTTKIRDFVETIKSMSKSPTILGFGDIPYISDEIMRSSADIACLKELGWSPTISVQEGIAKILSEYGVRTSEQ